MFWGICDKRICSQRKLEIVLSAPVQGEAGGSGMDIRVECVTLMVSLQEKSLVSQKAPNTAFKAHEIVMPGFTTIYVEILISGCVIFYIPECLQADNLKLYKSHPKLINESLLPCRFSRRKC